MNCILCEQPYDHDQHLPIHLACGHIVCLLFLKVLYDHSNFECPGETNGVECRRKIEIPDEEDLEAALRKMAIELNGDDQLANIIFELGPHNPHVNNEDLAHALGNDLNFGENPIAPAENHFPAIDNHIPNVENNSHSEENHNFQDGNPLPAPQDPRLPIEAPIPPGEKNENPDREIHPIPPEPVWINFLRPFPVSVVSLTCNPVCVIFHAYYIGNNKDSNYFVLSIITMIFLPISEFTIITSLFFIYKICDCCQRNILLQKIVFWLRIIGIPLFLCDFIYFIVITLARGNQDNLFIITFCSLFVNIFNFVLNIALYHEIKLLFQLSLLSQQLVIDSFMRF